MNYAPDQTNGTKKKIKIDNNFVHQSLSMRNYSTKVFQGYGLKLLQHSIQKIDENH